MTAGAGLVRAQQATDSPSAARPVPAALLTSTRPAFPQEASDLWLVPDPSARKAEKVLADFADGVRLLKDGKADEALPLLSAPGLASTPLIHYSTYYSALARLNLARPAEARAGFASVRAAGAEGYLAEASIQREAEAAVAQGDHAGAARLLETLVGRQTASPDAILLALGRAQRQAGEPQRAAETFARLYYEFPFSDLSAVAITELDGLQGLQPIKESPQRFKLELGRAERLFGSRRYQAARDAFEPLLAVASGDDAELVAMRVAECDHYLKRYEAARDRLAPFTQGASRKAEAKFFVLTATRELGDHQEYIRQARALLDESPNDSWAEETLNNLATHYILVDDDEAADATFRELYARFPKGRHAERAAWKAGWSSYKRGRFQEASAMFESAALGFPRSDYRPSYLYWSARAREQASDRAGALGLYRTIVSDYQHSYYGRLAIKRLSAAGIRTVSAEREPAAPAASVPPARPAQAGLITQLIALDLLDQAREELLYAQRTGDDSRIVTATLAWIANQTGDLRRGITLMKRAYPQYLSSEGDRLPDELMRVIFPVDYWPLIKRHASARSLDPHLVAALINQESTFQADVKSRANAIGLMQILPSTGRRLARTLRIRPFSAATLTRPEANIRMGTLYFSELVQRLGGLHYALASYNAGAHRVAVWTSERPGLDRDEFIDDIPYPETQNYVKRILGSMEDYRRLYGGEGATAIGDAMKAGSKSTPAVSKTGAAKRSATKPVQKKKAPAKKKASAARKK